MPGDADESGEEGRVPAAFFCVAALTPRSTLSRLANAFRSQKHPPPLNLSVSAALAEAASLLAAAGGAAETAVLPAADDGDGGTTPTCRLVRGGSLTADEGVGGSGADNGGGGNSHSHSSSTVVETFGFASAGLACRLAVRDCLSHCPVLAAAAAPSTLARVLPYTLVAPHAFVAALGTITNADELARRFDVRPSRRRDQQQQQHQQQQHPPSLPSFAAARDAALAEEVAGLSLTPPASGSGGGGAGGSSGGAGGNASSSSSSLFASAALSGVRRAVGVGETTARAVLAMFEEALESAPSSSLSSAVEALTLALSAVEGSFSFVLHDERRGVTLAARAASGDEGAGLWYALPPASDKGSGVVMIASAPLDLPTMSAGVTTAVESDGGGCGWREVPAGHFLLHGFGRGGGPPRLYQYALTREQLERRASGQEGPPITAAPERWRSRVLGAGGGGGGAAADAAPDDFHVASPVGSLNSGAAFVYD